MSNTICIVPECGHGVVGHWGDKDAENKGAVCWMFEQGSFPVDVPWPNVLHCRYCKKDFTKEEMQKQWLQPIYYCDKDKTFNCGCFPIDSSD